MPEHEKVRKLRTQSPAQNLLTRIRACVDAKLKREKSRPNFMKSSTNYDKAQTVLKSVEDTSDEVTLAVIRNLAKLFIYSDHDPRPTSKLKGEMLKIHNEACTTDDNSEFFKISPEMAYSKTQPKLIKDKFEEARQDIDNYLKLIEKETGPAQNSPS